MFHMFARVRDRLYDSDGAHVRRAPSSWRHVTREKVEDKLSQFRGEIQRAPPMYVHSFPLPSSHTNQTTTKKLTILGRFSALKMEGMPLYDYARKGIPLPRPIEKR